MKKLLIISFFLLVFNLSIKVVRASDCIYDDSVVSIPPDHEPSENGYQFNIDIRTELDTDVVLDKFEHETMSSNFTVSIKDKDGKEYEKLNREIMALVERYFKAAKSIPYYDPIWLLAIQNDEFTEYSPTYENDNIFTNWIVNNDLYLEESYKNYITGYTWKSVLRTYKKDFNRCFNPEETLIWEYPNNIFWYKRGGIISHSPIIPQDYGLIFTGGNINRRDLCITNEAYIKDNGMWQFGQIADRWSYADSFNQFFGMFNEFCYKYPYIVQEAFMDNYYKTSTMYMYAYENKDWTLLNDNSYREIIDYNWKYFYTLKEATYYYKYGKFRYQDKLMDIIGQILKSDKEANAHVMTLWYMYLHMEARYTGKW